jgi:hypothetical protein
LTEQVHTAVLPAQIILEPLAGLAGHRGATGFGRGGIPDTDFRHPAPIDGSSLPH